MRRLCWDSETTISVLIWPGPPFAYEKHTSSADANEADLIFSRVGRNFIAGQTTSAQWSRWEEASHGNAGVFWNGFRPPYSELRPFLESFEDFGKVQIIPSPGHLRPQPLRRHGFNHGSLWVQWNELFPRQAVNLSWTFWRAETNVDAKVGPVVVGNLQSPSVTLTLTSENRLELRKFAPNELVFWPWFLRKPTETRIYKEKSWFHWQTLAND